MWQERQTELLRGEIASLISPLSDTSGLYNLLKEPLLKSRRGLAYNVAYDRPWPLLPLIVCEAISGEYERALPVAAAIQLLMAAGDVFDDIEDADCSESLSTKYGSAVAINVATTLLILSEKALVNLNKRDIEDHVIVQIMDTISSLFTTACIGQHLDLYLTSKAAISEDTYLKIINMKSASQVECSCRVGAMLVTNDQKLINLFAEFGHNLGIAAQITNDIQGIIHGSDILEHKISLPMIYALTQTDVQVQNQLEAALSKLDDKSILYLEQVRELLFSSGAIHYAMIKLEFYKQRAMNSLSLIEAEVGNVERLKLLLE